MPLAASRESARRHVDLQRFGQVAIERQQVEAAVRIGDSGKLQVRCGRDREELIDRAARIICVV